MGLARNWEKPSCSRSASTLDNSSTIAGSLCANAASHCVRSGSPSSSAWSRYALIDCHCSGVTDFILWFSASLSSTQAPCRAQRETYSRTLDYLVARARYQCPLFAGHFEHTDNRKWAARDRRPASGRQCILPARCGPPRLAAFWKVEYLYGVLNQQHNVAVDRALQ
jgi:hypothetical protein